MFESELRRIFFRLKIDFPSNFHFGSDVVSNQDDYFVFFEGGFWVYMYCGRGLKKKLYESSRVDDIFVEVLSGYILDVASTWCGGLDGGSKFEDSRRCVFSRAIEIFFSLNVFWGEIYSERVNNILSIHPYDDFAVPRAEYIKGLHSMGESYEDAKKKAVDKYPLP